MRHAILVVGSDVQREMPVPELSLRGGESVRLQTWYANRRQQGDAPLLDDIGSLLLKVALVPVLAYQVYTLAHNTRLWSGKRPLLLVRGRGLASRIAAYAGSWGGGDVVKADQAATPPLGPTRFVLAADGRLLLRSGDEAE